MQVIKVTSDGPMTWELSHFNCRHFLGVSYAITGHHALGASVYCVDSGIYSVDMLIRQIPIWASEQRVDKVLIYSRNSDLVNTQLIDALKKLNLIDNQKSIEGREFIFQKAYVFCDTFGIEG